MRIWSSDSWWSAEFALLAVGIFGPGFPFLGTMWQAFFFIGFASFTVSTWVHAKQRPNLRGFCAQIVSMWRQPIQLRQCGPIVHAGYTRVHQTTTECNEISGS